MDFVRPEASVIVCTEAKRHTLRHTLEALKNQKGIRCEILLVVNGEVEALKRMVGEALLSNVKIIEKRSPILNRKRNQGIKEASSERFLFTDDDCVPESDWVMRACDSLKKCDIVTGRVIPLNKGFRLSTLTKSKKRLYRAHFFNRICCDTVGKGNNLSINRDAIKKYGLFNEAIGVGTWSQAACDTEYFFRVLSSNGGQVFYDPNLVVYHLQPTNLEIFLEKRRGYHRGISFLARCMYPNRLDAWSMALSRLIFACCQVFIYAVSLRNWRLRRALKDLRGAIEGFLPPKNQT